MSSDERQVRQSLVNGGGERRPGPSKLATHARVQRGSAAPLCGKPPAFRPAPDPSSSSAQAERLSLPACAEEDQGSGIGRKAGGFPHSVWACLLDEEPRSL